MADDPSNSEKKIGRSVSPSAKTLESQEDVPRTQWNVSPLSSFLLDLIGTVRKSLNNIANQTQVYEKEYSNNGLGECFFRIRNDIAKIDMLFESVLQYNRITTPFGNPNTIHNLIEKVLKKYQPALEKRETLIFRRFEKDLPQVIVPDEQLRYIVDTVIQYILGSMSSGGGISFSTKSVVIQDKEDEKHPLLEQNTRWVEILVVFTRSICSEEKAKNILGIQEDQTDQNPLDFLLQLVKKMIDKNRGLMKFELVAERNKSAISLLLPAEKEGSGLL